MDYSSSTLMVLNAIKSVQEADESIWLDRAMLAVADLFPSSSLAWALHQPAVWGRDRRRQVRLDESTALRYGMNLDDLIRAVETAAAADGAVVVRETHVAKALAQSAQTLQHLGISADSLIELAAERE